jgi:hypothetical protein
MTTQRPIRPHPENAHYFEFRGKPVALVTSAEHYGAVINLGFDYVAYLDRLKQYEMNYTRIYPGAYFETDGYFCKDNPLGPREGQHLLPWARSSVPGFPLGGNLFDLDTWDPAYFARLKDFVRAASDRGIVVEVCYFNCMYADMWPVMPLRAPNNIQGVGTMTHVEFQTLDDTRLVTYQMAYVRRIVEELAGFDNVIHEVIDEPLNYGPDEYRTSLWTSQMIEVVRDAMAGQAHPQIIAQQVIGMQGGPHDFGWDDRIQVATGQYVGQTWGGQRGGLELLDTHWTAGKPIELNETSYYPFWYEPEDMRGAVRAEAWEFMVGGGAAYNHLNGYFSNEDSSGDVPDNHAILGQLRVLRRFIESFDLLKMRPVFLTREIPDNTYARCSGDPGQAYMFYAHHSRLVKQQRYVPVHGEWVDKFSLTLPAGRYGLTWITPETGAETGGATLDHPGGIWHFETPSYRADIAMRLLREN